MSKLWRMRVICLSMEEGKEKKNAAVSEKVWADG